MNQLKYACMTVALLALAACGQTPTPEAAPTEVPAEEVVEAPSTVLKVSSYDGTLAAFTDGGHASGGTRYAKEGTSLTLTVNNKGDAKCIEVRAGTSASGTLLHRKADNSLSDNHTFLITAGTVNTATAFAYKTITTDKSKNVTGCTEQSGGTPWFASASYTLDNTVPTISGSVAPAPNKPAAQNGWFRDDVVVSWTCSDAGSGVKSCTASETVTGEGNNLSRTGNAEDNVGNKNSATVNFKIDRTAPNTTADAPSGWQTRGVTVTLSAADPLSGVASTQYSVNNGPWITGMSIQLLEGRHTLQYRSTDVAGNVEGIRSATVDIDLTAPTIESSQNPVKNGAGWNNSNVTVSFTCDDSVSGVASCTTPQSVTAEGISNVRGEAIDVAGRNNIIFHDVSLDKTAPTIDSVLSGTLGNNGWYTSNVTVAFNCADVGGSGIARCTSNTTLEGEGAGQSVIGNALDVAGNPNSDTASGIKIDKTAPSTSSNAPSGWQASDFTLTFTASDGHSGVAFTEYSRDGGQTWTRGGSVTLSDGSHTVLYRSTDNAGNEEQQKSATVKVDTTAPVVTISGPPSMVDESATVTGSASDTGSGVASVTVNGTAVTLDNGTFSTSVSLACGSNTITATATDGVRRSSSASTTIERTCTVVQPPANEPPAVEPPAAPVWSSKGFFAPVDMNTPTKKYLNGTKGGSTVPLKFQVFKDGVEVKDAAVASFKAGTIACESTATFDSVEVVTSGSTTLRYDGTQWIQNWKTPTALGCYRAVVVLADNTTVLSADFRITK